MTLTGVLWAAPVDAQNIDKVKVDLKFDQTSLQQSLLILQRKSGVQISFANQLLAKENKKVTLDAHDISVRQAILKILSQTNLTYRIEKDYVIIDARLIPAKLGRITGKVMDEKGDPLPGANIRIVELNRNFSGNNDGSYSIEVNPGTYSIEVRYASFITQLKTGVVVEEGKSASVDFVLKEDSKTLNEVVVTALGIERESKKLGYSVQVVKGDKLTKAHEASPLAALTGKVAGLNIYNSNEMLAAPRYNLRGASPVIVVDGVPVSTDFYDIKPDDIESINVLKGTTASALYGSRGKDGAIMITTKRGNIGKNAVEVQVNSSMMFQSGFLTLPEVQTRWGTGNNGKYTLTEDIGSPNGDAGGGSGQWGPKLDAGLNVVQWDSPIDPQTGNRIATPWVSRGKNNLEDFVQMGATNNSNLSVSKSFDKGSVRFSLSNMYQKGQIPNTKFSMTGLSLASTYYLTPSLHTDAYLSYSKQYTPNYPTAGYGRKNSIFNVLIWEGADTDIKDFKNYWQQGKEGFRQIWYNYTEYNNPWFVANELLREHKKDVVTGRFSMTYDFSPEFNLTGRVAVNNANRFGSLKIPFSFLEYSGRTITFGTKGGYQTENEYNFDLNADFLATYHKKMSENFEVQVVGGGNMRYVENMMQGLKADGLNVPGVYTFANATNPLILPQSDLNYVDRTTNFLNKQQVNSLYASVDISFYKAFNLSLTGRMDQSSALPIKNNQYFYPSSALAVVVSDLIKMPKYISYAKLRSSVAQVSSDLSVYQLAQAYNTGVVWNGNTSVSMPGNINNPNILPSKSTTTEVGAEVYFFGNRLKLDGAYFSTLDQNSIISLPSSQAAGFSSHTENANEFLRKGAEISLGATPIKSKDFKWNTIINWSTYKQTIKKLDPVLNGNLNGMKEGERTDQLIAGGFAYTPEGELIVNTNGKATNNPNNVLHGYSNPDWTGGWSNTFQYKNFALNVDIDGRFGGTIYCTTKEKMVSWGSDLITDDEYNRTQFNNGIPSMVIKGVVLDPVTNKYVPNTTPILTKDYYSFIASNRGETNWMDGTFAKVREISITYNMPKKLLSKTFLKDASLSLIGKNLFIISNSELKKYADPDAGVDNLPTPAPRNYGLNLNLKF